ncbi:MAG: hypothetical protein Q9162_005345 [Coniocarpon cinnabarinum]
MDRGGHADEELFLQQPAAKPNTVPSPLRINKSPQNSPPPPNQSSSGAPNARPQPPYPVGYTEPTSPPPNRPLPYPDDRAQGSASRPGPNQQSSSGASGARYGSPATAQQAYQRPHYVPNASQGPSVGGPWTSQHAQGGHGAGQNTSKPLPDSPGPDTPDKDAMYQKTAGNHPEAQRPAGQYYYPPPQPTGGELRIPNAAGVNRLTSVSSVSTTKAARGSPPPPETPVEMPSSGGIEARYAAAGIAGPNTLNALEAQRLASQQRQQEQQWNQESQQQQQRPWASSSQAGATQTGAVRQDAQGSSGPGDQTPRPNHNELASDIERLQVSEEPPPAYSSVTPQSQGYPQEKQRPAANNRQGLSISTAAANAAATGGTGAGAVVGGAVPQTQQPPNLETHPAFANDHNTPQPVHHQTHPSDGSQYMAAQDRPQTASPTPSQAPPPLPEGWIAHMDPNSGQYYYIHLPTQATQWEFPKGPTPLNAGDQVPLSPTGTIVNNPFASPTASTFAGKPLPSAGYPDRPGSVMTGISTITSPTAAGFHVPPPNSGVERYRIAPTNGVYFGPYLRYTNMDCEQGVWYGSILLVTDAQSPPTIHIHQSTDLSPNPRQLKANHIYTHQRWSFYRYDIDLKMEDDHEARWTYAITSHLGCTRYEFLVAAKYETSWRFIAHSGNDFSLNVSPNERQKIGGIGYMWRDIMTKHVEVGGFHCQLGMGNQIYADRLWREIPALRQWTATSGKDNRKNAPWTAQLEDDVTHSYFHYYTSHFDQPHLREAFAQIPHVLTVDDHDVFDGFGSYPEHMQFSNMFKNIGRIGIELYLLFQHHTTLQILRNVTNDMDLFTITGTGWHFLKYLGPAVVVVGPDCRSERNPYQVMAGPTYQGLFPKVAVLPPHVQHCIWMVPVPLVYPRLETAEQFAQTMATGKKAVTGTFNALGKVTAGVAGIVGAKGVVGEGFNSVKKAVGKSGLMSNVLSPFGEIDFLDELRDMWTHESKDLERTYLIRTLQGIASTKSLRMSFFSGATNCCGAGLLSDPSVAPPSASHKAMFQIISSSVVNAPPSAYVLRMLHPHHSGNSNSGSAKPLYVPPNGQRSRHDGQPTDTKEDMLDVFGTDVTGQSREMKRLMGRRNYVAVVSYDPEAVSEAFGQSTVAGSAAGSVKDGVGAGGPGHAVSLAVDFFVQSDQANGQLAGGPSTVKYGPLTIPSVAPGH